VKIKTLRAGNNGFTLLEILVVLLIISIAASVVVFSAGSLHEKTVYRQEVRRLFQTVKHARNISLQERRNITFNIDSENKKYWIDNGGNMYSEVHSLPDKFFISGESIFFFPKGNSSGGIIKIDNGKGRKYQIEIDPLLGKPSLKRL
jgi:general secretion pathway protein H